MLRRIVTLVTLSATIALTGCASSLMRPVEDPQPIAAQPQKTRVVFMRSTFLGSAISASVYDVKNGEPKFIGIVNNSTKLAYDTEPGQHVFMVVSEAADYLRADLAPGKTYYSVVVPRMGAWKARFSLYPVRTDGSTDYNTAAKSFTEMLAGTKWVGNSPESEQWFSQNQADVKAKNTEYWPQWLAKPEDERKQATLLISDGN
ncbi:hypothetical protein ACDA63_15765 [Uliginosibacterium sp. sgz301328]|uniref:hypothetical protein n=1 Tax=Uliginosibacterium sp. sgz301328 TaxID=3243764 RepID=UPI00359E646B